jgi:prolyl oligopeptidase
MPLTNFIYAPIEELIHGVLVRDPYRWLEDRDLPETEKWILDQNRRHEKYFADCSDLDRLRKRVRSYLDIEVLDQPAKIGDGYFYRRRDRGEEQVRLYVREPSGAARLLVDPSDKGSFASVGIYRISEDGSLLAYEVRRGGTDKTSICFLDVETGRTLPASVDSGYARGLVFTSDNQGFFCCHQTPEDAREHVIFLRRFHEPIADQVIFRHARSSGSRLVLTADEVHLGAIWTHQCGETPVADLWIARRDEPENWQQVFADRTLPCRPILRRGRILALDYKGAPNGRLVELSDEGCELCTIIPEQERMIRQIAIRGERIFVSCLENLIPRLECWSLAGKWQGRINTPPNGDLQLLPHPGCDQDSLFFTFQSFVDPPAIFEYSSNAEEPRLWHQWCSPLRGKSSSIRQVTYPSRDGVQIPMTLLGREARDPATADPLLMTAYGGFGVPMTPQFSVLVSIMVELGVAFALPHIRGGGEFGKTWHDAARGLSRQTAFDDFIAAADWLCARGETSPEKLAIFGGSNSGLLVAVAMTQRPKLFRAVLCIAPLLDMVRYEDFDRAAQWRQEYGTVQKAEEFGALFAYSPYHHVHDSLNYPAVLFVTGDNDDRCNPAHVRKMVARLQQRGCQINPVLVDYSLERGHAPVLPLTVRTEALAQRIAFLSRELRIAIPRWEDSDESTCV